ncbi:hypothetical protein [Rhizobium johnstonii]|uniref:hypothetical protein n=1 Tax=Rhizobium johnstonii TaxID=3019933 RepID=UPI002DDD04A1|nr:hypothetical protein U8P72_11885 [Rhizobium johnstonii]
MSKQEHLDTLEERQFELDAEIRRREVAVKESERKSGWLTPAQATVAGALLALTSGIVGAYINARSSQVIASGNSLTSLQIEELKAKGTLELEKTRQTATAELERKKFETNLILEAIRTPSRSDAIRNLKFFVSAGFVTDEHGKIAALSEGSLPSIGQPSQQSINRAVAATGVLSTVDGEGQNSACTGVALSQQYIVSDGICAGDVGSKATFYTGKILFHMTVAERKGRLALLKADQSEAMLTYLERSSVREPLLSERVYLARASFGSAEIVTSTCSVIGYQPDEGDFHHDCDTGPGSTGAVIIAVSDNSLLGIHYARSESSGVARLLSTILPEFSETIYGTGR